MGEVNPDPILSSALFQVFYRQLGMISLHIGVKAMVESARRLQPERGGEIDEILPERVYQWRGVEVFPGTGMRMNVWLVGSAMRQKNCLLMRVGWWTLWVLVKPSSSPHSE